MSTPYDTDDELLAEQTRQIRSLNDAFRTDPFLIGSAIVQNKLVITAGVAEHGTDFTDRAVTAVRKFSQFTEANDPCGEHDFGSFGLDGFELFWKIDYYDCQLEWGSPDPADPAVTRRILTIMLAAIDRDSDGRRMSSLGTVAFSQSVDSTNQAIAPHRLFHRHNNQQNE
jgi:hypothetical protein